MDPYVHMAVEAEKYKAPGINVELECRMIIPTITDWKDYESLTIPYFRLLSHPTLNVRKVGGMIETKELVNKINVDNVSIFISIEKQYHSKMPDILIPRITREVQRKIIKKHPLTVINYENKVFTLEVEYDTATVEECKEIIKSYLLPMWPAPKPIDAYASEFISKMLHGKYCLTPKADGDHVVVYISFDDKSFYITDNGCIVGQRFTEHPKTVMEGEFADGEIHLYDVMIANGKDVTYLPLKERREFYPQYHFKEIHPFTTYNSLVKAFKKCKATFSTDGIIMTSMGPYYDTVYKSKSLPTVDLQYIDGYLYLANEKNSNRLPIGDVHLENGKIYEFDMKMKYIRAREDKIIPNYRMPVEIDPITNIVNGNGIPNLRYHHNYVKLKMLKLLPQTVLLDVGSGYGGDINKWDEFKKVYAVDPELNLRSKPKNVIPLRCTVQNIPEIEYESASIFFVQWDFSILSSISAKHVMMIVMDNPKPISNDLYTVKIVGDKVHVSIPGTVTAENIVENKVNVSDIDRFMKARRYECIKINYEMKFGSTEEIALSKMYSYLYYKRR
jgi:hypothetical protein